MDFDALDAALQIENDRFSLTGDTLPGANLGPLLARYNDGASMDFTEARKEFHREDGWIGLLGAVTFRKAQFRGQARFALDGNGDPQVEVTLSLYESPGGRYEAGSWQFTNAFTKIPPFSGLPYDLFLAGKGGSVLRGAGLVLRNYDSAEMRSGSPVQLVTGLNFVAVADIRDLFGPLAGLFEDQSLHLAGHVRVPAADRGTGRAADAAPSVWDDPNAMGLLLTAPLSGVLPWPDKPEQVVKNLTLRLYLPLDAEWVEANPDYLPRIAVTGQVRLPEFTDDIPVEAVVSLDRSDLTLRIRPPAGALRKLESLKNVLGDLDLAGALPEPLDSQVEQAASTFSLVDLGIRLTVEENRPRISQAFAGVGLIGLNLQLFGVALLENLVAHFMVNRLSGETSLYVEIDGSGAVTALSPDATFDFTVAMPDGTAVATLDDARIPLGNALEKLELPGVSGDIRIDHLELTVAGKRGYELRATVAEADPWTLDLGEIKATAQDLRFRLTKPAGGDASGSFGGVLALRTKGGTTLSLTCSFDVPGDLKIKAWFPDGSLRALVDSFNAIGLQLPGDFDIAFSQSWAEISRHGDDFALSAATGVDNLGTIGVVGRRDQGTWGFAALLAIDVDGLANLPGLGVFTAFDDFLGLTDLVIVVSSLSDPGFAFPRIEAPDINLGKLELPEQARGVDKGLFAYARIDLAGSRAMQTLAEWLDFNVSGGLAAVAEISLPDPSAGSTLFVEFDTEVNNMPIKGRFGALYQDGTPALFLDGTLTASVQGRPFDVQVGVLVLTNGILIRGDYRGTLRFFVGDLDFRLSNVGLVVGIDFEAIPSFGFAATLDVAGKAASIALFFDSVEPTKSMFVGSVSKISLREIVEGLAGQAGLPAELKTVLGQVALKEMRAFSLDLSVTGVLNSRDLVALAIAFAGQGVSIPSSSDKLLLTDAGNGVWYLTDLSGKLEHYALRTNNGRIDVSLEPQVYCVPQQTRIGEITYQSGFRVQAAFQLFFIKVNRLLVDIETSKGVAFEVDVDRITLVSNEFLSITGLDRWGPKLSLSTYTRNDQSDPDLRNPHLLVSGSMYLLGTHIGSVHLKAGSSGLSFDLKSRPIDDDMSLDIHGTFADLSNLHAEGHISVHFEDAVWNHGGGVVRVDSVFSGTLDIGVQSGSPHAKLSGSIDLPLIGESHLPTIDLTDKSLGWHLQGLLVKEIRNVYQLLFRNPEHWLDGVRKGVVREVRYVGSVGSVVDFVGSIGFVGRGLSSLFDLSHDGIAQVMHAVGMSAEEIGTAMREVGATAEEIGTAMRNVGASAEEIGTAMRNAGASAEEIYNALKRFDHTTETISRVLPGFNPHINIPWPPHADADSHVDRRIDDVRKFFGF